MKHAHTWEPVERLLADDEARMKEKCSDPECGVSRTRKMTEAEAADYEQWRAEMSRLDREGVGLVE